MNHHSWDCRFGKFPLFLSALSLTLVLLFMCGVCNAIQINWRSSLGATNVLSNGSTLMEGASFFSWVSFPANSFQARTMSRNGLRTGAASTRRTTMERSGSSPVRPCSSRMRPPFAFGCPRLHLGLPLHRYSLRMDTPPQHALEVAHCWWWNRLSGGLGGR